MGNVTKKDLVEDIAERTGLTQVDTKIVIESFLEAVSGALQKGTNIEIRGFGRFKIKRKKARTARNPRTNECIEVDSGYKPVFEASRELRKRVDDRYQRSLRGEAVFGINGEPEPPTTPRRSLSPHAEVPPVAPSAPSQTGTEPARG